ncbi:MAG: tRNA (N6-isopentenyl adenosine(37)-C2)-methylthiotransferase MiaB [Thermodesulfobacteriota bacterium]|nr:tRNA (N6-isopentenyl adenosine(37)-C2)-methylthiotransferase MiaB [Thermodesulfobacteriota bacterium]
MSKKAYIATFGCQMNEYDSEQMAGILSNMAYETTEDLAGADLVLVNTCCIRQKAEEKAYSFLGRLRKFKKKNPDLMVIVAGCLAQQEGRRLFKKNPCLNLVIGPQGIHRLPELLREAEKNARRITCTELATSELPGHVRGLNGKRTVTAYVGIMTGCNNFCSYCIVPYVRGREFSRRGEEILKEIRGLVEQGVKEITLLGQNVNSYGLRAAGECSFAGLIRKIGEVDGLERLRFTTSHPKDISDDLIECFGSVKSLCEHIHLPIQSGSDRILRRMNRKYTRDDYLEKVAKLRRICPDISITTDLIAGFPGETEADFKDTLDIMRQVRFAGAFAFKYSDRPPAKAVTFSDKLPEPVTRERLSRLLALQKEITYNRNKSMVGKRAEVLVEGYSKSSPREWMGRARTNEVVNFSGDGDLPGKVVTVAVEKACLHSLKGSLAVE